MNVKYLYEGCLNSFLNNLYLYCLYFKGSFGFTEKACREKDETKIPAFIITSFLEGSFSEFKKNLEYTYGNFKSSPWYKILMNVNRCVFLISNIQL